MWGQRVARFKLNRVTHEQLAALGLFVDKAARPLDLAVAGFLLVPLAMLSAGISYDTLGYTPVGSDFVTALPLLERRILLNAPIPKIS